MSGWQLIGVGAVLLAAYVAVLVYLDRKALAVSGPAHDDAAMGNVAWVWLQAILLIGGHFFIVVGAVKAILGLAPSYGAGAF